MTNVLEYLHVDAYVSKNCEHGGRKQTCGLVYYVKAGVGDFKDLTRNIKVQRNTSVIKFGIEEV